jgi:hypothetical protein
MVAAEPAVVLAEKVPLGSARVCQTFVEHITATVKGEHTFPQCRLDRMTHAGLPFRMYTCGSSET